MKVTFDHAQEEAANITTFYFKPESSVNYTAGQYVKLTLPHFNPDERGDHRWFTLSSSPNESLVSITTKFTDEKGSSFKNALRSIVVGTELNMSDPMGDFVLPKLLQTPLIFVAGGIGITPFHSMLTWLTENKEVRPIKFIYGVRTEDEIVFLETFKKASQHATIVVAEPSAEWGGERGNLSAELILGLEHPTDDTLIYISGPEPMVESLQKDLIKAGIKKSQLVGDFFPNYTTI